MRNIVIATGLLFLLAGCSSLFVEEDNRCGGQGHKNVKVVYGDGMFSVDAVVKVGKKRELRFKLDPDRGDSVLGYDYEKTLVETSGKTAADAWLNGSGAYDPDKYFMVCVDEGLEVNKHYNYTVTFTDPVSKREIGVVDPRIIIEP